MLLKDYLKEKGYCFEKNKFYDDFFYWAEKQLNLTPEKNNAGFNRLPSLIQLCILFDLVESKNGKLSFKIERLKHQPIPEIKRAYTKDELEKSAKEEKIIEASAEELVARYGEDGNVIVSAIVRNSSLQAKFKHNLLIQQKGKCVICGVEQKELLIGSHIKPSAKCNVNEKIDYNNGLLLCCNHDKLFDKYLISFDADTGKIMISGSLKQNDIKRLNIPQDYRLGPDLLSEERKKYLCLHNNKFKEEENLRN
ncbi:MAG: HNH endonuclease [Clostridia bacterium]|nr:HNH endonuclease [Clostridia bacterium]